MPHSRKQRWTPRPRLHRRPRLRCLTPHSRQRRNYPLPTGASSPVEAPTSNTALAAGVDLSPTGASSSGTAQAAVQEAPSSAASPSNTALAECPATPPALPPPPGSPQLTGISLPPVEDWSGELDKPWLAQSADSTLDTGLADELADFILHEANVPEGMPDVDRAAANVRAKLHCLAHLAAQADIVTPHKRTPTLRWPRWGGMVCDKFRLRVCAMDCRTSLEQIATTADCPATVSGNI